MKTSEFFQRTMDWYVDGIGFRDEFSSPTVSPDGAHDAIGNTVKVNDIVKILRGSQKGSLKRVVFVKEVGYRGRMNIRVEGGYIKCFYHYIKV